MTPPAHLAGAFSSSDNDARTREPLAIVVLVGGLPVAAELPAETLAALREALVVTTPAPAVSPYLTADEAADVLRCRRRRIYELCSDGRLTRHGEGRRLLVARAEVERLAAGELTRC